MRKLRRFIIHVQSQLGDMVDIVWYTHNTVLNVHVHV